MIKDTLGIIFAHEKVDAMRELTESRTVASVPFGGRYRMIDFVLSSMVNSGIKNVGVVTKSDYYSLMAHLGTGKEWDLNRKRGGLSILPPSINGPDVFSEKSGKISVLMGIIDYIRNSDCKYVLLADANVIANIDYTDLLAAHIEKHAYMTALYKANVYDHSKFKNNAFIDVDSDGRITDIAINQDIQLHSKMLLGTYIIERSLLEFLVCQCIAHNKFDFERDVIQEMFESLDIYAYEYSGYAEKIDNLETYFKVNLELLDINTRQKLFDEGGEILTHVRDEVPTMFGTDACVKNSILADGCFIEGTVENCVLSRNVRVSKGAVVKNCVLMQGTEIGPGATLEYCITDNLVNITEGVSLRGAETYPTVLPKGCKI